MCWSVGGAVIDDESRVGELEEGFDAGVVYVTAAVEVLLGERSAKGLAMAATTDNRLASFPKALDKLSTWPTTASNNPSQVLSSSLFSFLFSPAPVVN